MGDGSIRDMIQFIHSYLIPKIDPSQSKTLSKLTTFTYTLSLQDLQSMDNEISSLFTSNPQIAQNAQFLYYACYFIAVLDHQPFDLTYFNFMVNIISYFKENCSNFDIKDSVSLMLNKIILAVTSCGDINELLSWAEKIKQIKQELQYEETETEESWVAEEIKMILLEKALDNDKQSIKWSIQAAKMVEDAGFDISSVSRIIINNAINWIEKTNDTLEIAEIIGEIVEKDDQGAREILEILKSLKIKDEELLSTINSLSKRFGVIETFISSSRVVLSKDRLKFDYIPMHLSTNEQNQLRKTILKGVLDGTQEVCIKTYSHWKLDQLAIYQKEREILEGISGLHPTFLTFYGSYLEEKSEKGLKVYEFSMVTELCEGNLFADITRRQKEHRPYTKDEYLNIVKTLLEGFSYLEARKIYHKDIKPEHIFLTRDGKPKIAEFGVATDIKSIQGRKDFMSPELYSAYKEYRKNPNAPVRINYKPKKSDVYSLGLVFLNMYTLQTVKGLNERKAQLELQDYVSRFKPDWIATMLQQMLNPDYTRRVSFEYIMF